MTQLRRSRQLPYVLVIVRACCTCEPSLSRASVEVDSGYRVVMGTFSRVVVIAREREGGQGVH